MARKIYKALKSMGTSETMAVISGAAIESLTIIVMSVAFVATLIGTTLIFG